MKCRPTASERLATPASARAQQQRGRIHRARGKDDEPGEDRSCARRRHATSTPVDALAVRLDEQPLDARVLPQFDIAVSKRLAETAGLGVHLAGPRVGKGVPRRFRAREPVLDVDAERQRKGMQPDALQALANCCDRRLVGHRTERIGRGVLRLGRIEAERAADL